MVKKLLMVAIAACLPLHALAETDWPQQKPVTLIVPFPAGGSTDMVARAIAVPLQKALNQNFVVDNRPGATGAIGAGMVKRAAPDGYTLLVSSLATYVITPHLQKGLPYDPMKDFDYISMPIEAPNVLVENVARPERTTADVLALLRANPGKISFASSGNGSSDHLSAELFWQQTNTTGLHVPYKGGAPAVNDLLGNQVNFLFTNVNTILPYVRAGKLRAIVMTGNKRSPALPDVPTLAEAGVKDAEVYSWQGIAAPKGLTPELKKKLGDAMIAAIQDPQVKQRMLDQGLEVVASTPDEFTAFQARESARWKDLIEKRKITIQ